ncbi:MAG: MATE family efflux transporter [Steroidobacteraceae bacterium]
MRDLTQGPIPGHLLAMAAPIAAGMLAQTLYFLVDLYFVAALAGVGAAGIAMFVVMAATLVGGYAVIDVYMRTVGADAATVDAGATYLKWFLPGLALQYVSMVMTSGLRGTGVVKPTMIVQMATVLLNAILAPVLIAGVGTGRPMGVAGAGFASTISVAAGVVLLSFYFLKLEKYVHFRTGLWRPQFAVWGRMVNIGLPAGGEFGFMFLYMAVIYWVIRDFGAAAQAGFGLGTRLMQSIFLPAMAIAFATGPVAGQNFGAKLYPRVYQTFWTAAKLSVVLMLALTLLCQFRPEWLVLFFTRDPAVVDVAAHFLRLISFNFAASGLIFTCSGIFQGLGHTWPALGSTASRIFTFMLPAVWLSTLPGLELDHVWYLSVASVWLQAALSLWLLRRTMRARL